MIIRSARIIAPLVVAITVSACASIDYDSQADSQLTSITQETNQQLYSWASQAEQGKPITYDSTFYDKVSADITTLEIRMESSQNAATPKLVSDFDSLRDQIQKLQAFHRKKGSIADPQFFRAEAMLLNPQFASLTTFELSLKSSSAGGQNASTATSSTSGKATKAGAAGTVSAALSP